MKTNRDVIVEGLRSIGLQDVIPLIPQKKGKGYSEVLDRKAGSKNPRVCLATGFFWRGTEQGYCYWKDISQNLRDLGFMQKIEDSDADEAAKPHPSDPYPEHKAPLEPQHWTARMAPMEAKFTPAFFGFLRNE